MPNSETVGAGFRGLFADEIDIIRYSNPEFVDFVRDHPDASDDDLTDFAQAWAQTADEDEVRELAEQSAYFELSNILDTFKPKPEPTFQDGAQRLALDWINKLPKMTQEEITADPVYIAIQESTADDQPAANP